MSTQRHYIPAYYSVGVMICKWVVTCFLEFQYFASFWYEIYHSRISPMCSNSLWYKIYHRRISPMCSNSLWYEIYHSRISRMRYNSLLLMKSYSWYTYDISLLRRGLHEVSSLGEVSMQGVSIFPSFTAHLPVSYKPHARSLYELKSSLRRLWGGKSLWHHSE